MRRPARSMVQANPGALKTGVSDEKLISIWLYGRGTNTQRTYKTAIRAFRLAVGKPLSAVSLEDVQRWDAHLKAGALSASTRQHRLSVLRSLFQFGLAHGYLPRDPTWGVRLPRPKDTLAERVLTQDEVRRILGVARARANALPRTGRTFLVTRLAEMLGMSPGRVRVIASREHWPIEKSEVIKGTGRGAIRGKRKRAVSYRRSGVEWHWRHKPVRDYALLLLMYATGARVSEIVGLCWKDARQREDDNTLLTLFGKGDKTRRVIVVRRVWQDVERLREEGAPLDDHIFQGLVGGKPAGPLSREKVWRILRSVAAEAGIKAPVSPHWLRHSHATHALQNGAPIHVVKESLGHASLNATERYLHITDGQTSGTYLRLAGRTRGRRQKQTA